jgi:hypothetical protein
LSEPEVPDEAYVAAAIADRGFEVDRGVGGYDAEVRFIQPHRGYNGRGGVSVLASRARDFMSEKQASDECEPADPEDAPAGPAEVKARPFIACTAEDMGFPPDPPKKIKEPKIKKPRKKPTT